MAVFSTSTADRSPVRSSRRETVRSRGRPRSMRAPTGATRSHACPRGPTTCRRCERGAGATRRKGRVARGPLPGGPGLPAVIAEWDVGDRASVQHDIVVHPAGYIYAADTTKDMLYRLDPRTGERRSFKIPDAGLPLAGIFARSTNVLPPNADAPVAPHSPQVAPDCKIWVTLCLGNKIGIFDPATEH